ncbi:hypothetical protein MAR_007318, partial [Mya arenaria]
MPYTHENVELVTCSKYQVPLGVVAYVPYQEAYVNEFFVYLQYIFQPLLGSATSDVYQFNSNITSVTVPSSRSFRRAACIASRDTVNKVDLTVLKCDVQLILDVVGSHPTEQACEAECYKVIQEGHFLNYGCPLVCL